MSQLTQSGAMEVLKDLSSNMRELVHRASEASAALDHPYVLEGIVMALKQVTDPGLYNVPTSVVAPLTDLIALVASGESNIDLRFACAWCGLGYDTEGEAQLCQMAHDKGDPYDEGARAVQEAGKTVALVQVDGSEVYQLGPSSDEVGTGDDLHGRGGALEADSARRGD